MSVFHQERPHQEVNRQGLKKINLGDGKRLAGTLAMSHATAGKTAAWGAAKLCNPWGQARVGFQEQ